MTLTQIFILIIFALVLIYTSIAQKTLHQHTVSKTLRDWAWKYNTIGWVAGFLIGHWFFPRQTVVATAWGFGIPLLVALVGWDVYWNLKVKVRKWYRLPGIYVVLGIVTGIILWSQGSKDSPIP